MYSKSEQAALAALLDRARKNDHPREGEIEDILGAELYAEFKARWHKIYLDEKEDVLALGVLLDSKVERFRDYVNVMRREYDSMARRLPKLQAQVLALNHRIMAHQNYLARAKDNAQAVYKALPDDSKDWLAPDSEEDGWPPKVYDKAPLKVIFRRLERHSPVARALEVICARELGIDP